MKSLQCETLGSEVESNCENAWYWVSEVDNFLPSIFLSASITDRNNTNRKIISELIEIDSAANPEHCICVQDWSLYPIKVDIGGKSIEKILTFNYKGKKSGRRDYEFDIQMDIRNSGNAESRCFECGVQIEKPKGDCGAIERLKGTIFLSTPDIDGSFSTNYEISLI